MRQQIFTVFDHTGLLSRQIRLRLLKETSVVETPSFETSTEAMNQLAPTKAKKLAAVGQTAGKVAGRHVSAQAIVSATLDTDRRHAL